MDRFIKKSAVIHVTVLVLVIVLPSLFSRRFKQKILPVHTVELIKTSDIIVPKQPEIVKPKIKKPVPKPKPEPAKTKPKPVKKVKKQKWTAKPKQPSLEEKLSERLKNIETPDTKPIKQDQKKQVFSGNREPKLKATVSSIRDFPFQWYISFIQSKISSCWNQPQMVIAKNYSCVISFTILKNGGINNVKIKKSSGLDNFNQSTVQAVELAQPLPPLPPGYKHSQLVVNVEFSLE